MCLYYMTGAPEGSTENISGEAKTGTCHPLAYKTYVYPLHHGGDVIRILRSSKMKS